MPRKYKPTKSSYLPKPQNFKPSKITSHTIVNCIRMSKLNYIAIATTHYRLDVMKRNMHSIPEHSKMQYYLAWLYKGFF